MRWLGLVNNKGTHTQKYTDTRTGKCFGLLARTTTPQELQLITSYFCKKLNHTLSRILCNQKTDID